MKKEQNEKSERPNKLTWKYFKTCEQLLIRWNLVLRVCME